MVTTIRQGFEEAKEYILKTTLAEMWNFIVNFKMISTANRF
jgi:hypothetical protein